MLIHEMILIIMDIIRHALHMTFFSRNILIQIHRGFKYSIQVEEGMLINSLKEYVAEI